MLSNNLIKLAEIFHKTSPLYLVGGYVRDFLLYKHSTDIDICSKLTTDKVIELLDNSPYKCKIINEKLGTILITIGNERYEYTPFREESYQNNGEHSPQKISFNVDIKKDAMRRDFTINAIYYDIVNKQIIDVVGGSQDINSRLVKTICEPDKVFSEDALRIFRLARLTVSTGFDVDSFALESCRKMAKLVGNLSSERVVDEYKKTVNSIETSEIITYVDLLGNLNVIDNWYTNSKTDKYRLTDATFIFRPSLKLLYLAIFERYFYYLTEYADNVNLGSFEDIKNIENRLKSTFNSIFSKDKLPNRVKKEVFDLLTFARLYLAIKNEVQLDILLCRYYNIINSLIMGMESKIMVKNTAFMDIIDRLTTLASIPKEVKDLPVKAEDLVELGVDKTALSTLLNEILFAVWSKKIGCQKEDIIRFITEKK